MGNPASVLNMRRDITAVIPAFNCAPTIGEVVEGCRRYLERVVVVDDGSQDHTAELARAAGAEVESLERNRGKGFALRRGIDLALAPESKRRPAAVLLLDGDGQHAPEDIPCFLEAWDRGEATMIIGSRMRSTEEIPRARLFTNYIGSRILSWMTGEELEDSQSGFRLVDARLLADLNLNARGYAVESEMVIKAARRGARFAHVPITTIYDSGVASHFRPIRDTARISFASVYYKVFDES